MTFSNVKNTKKIEDILVENITKTHYEYEAENPPRHSGAGQVKHLQQILN